MLAQDEIEDSWPANINGIDADLFSFFRFYHCGLGCLNVIELENFCSNAESNIQNEQWLMGKYRKQ